MRVDQAIGYVLAQASAIAALVSTRVYHGLRPNGATLPCINFYAVGGAGGRWRGIEAPTYSINCRADSASGAEALSKLVVDAFHGSSGTGMYGTVTVTAGTSFDVARVSLRTDQGLIPEPADGVFNAPVDITVVYAVDTVI